VAVVLLAAGAAYFGLRPRPDTGPLRLAGGEPLCSVRGEGERTRVALHDGSTLLLSDATIVEAVENGAERVVLVQGDGRAVYDVRPGGPRRWSVDAGALTVDVVGTRFSVVRAGRRVRVEVERGRVRVRGEAVDGGLRSLGAGEWVEVGARRGPGAAPHPGPPPLAGEGVAPASRPTDETAPMPDDPAPAPRDAARWRALADRGDWDDAYDALGEHGLRDASRRSRSVDELFALADTARLSGHPALAVDPLRRLMDEHPRDPRAAVAALTLGRLQLDALDQPEAAVTSLERALELGVPARLSETTLARLVEAHHRAGHAEAARRVGARYLSEHPDGRNAARVRGWTQPR
jgi:transmembrane sensor